MPALRFGSATAALVLAAGLMAGCGIFQKSEADLANEALQRGIAAQDAGKIDEARTQFFAALGHDPTNKFAYYNLGQIARAQQKYAIAEGYYRQALEVDPSDPGIQFGLAYALMAQPVPANQASYLQEAIELYRKVVATQPNNASAHYNLGIVLRASGQGAAADAEFARAQQLDANLRAPAPTATQAPPATNRPSATPAR